MGWSCQNFETLSGRDVYEILQLRVDVFVVEQECPYHEIDGNDYEALHIIYRDERGVGAYARLLPAGVNYDAPSIGRVIVRKDLRGGGFAHTLMENALNYMLKRWQPEKINLQAQTHLAYFYEGHGFTVISESYLEDGIPHVDMVRVAQSE